MNPPAGKGKRDPQEILSRHKERAKGKVRQSEQERQERQERGQGRPGRQQPGQG
jgi:hypothetical protein